MATRTVHFEGLVLVGVSSWHGIGMLHMSPPPPRRLDGLSASRSLARTPSRQGLLILLGSQKSPRVSLPAAIVLPPMRCTLTSPCRVLSCIDHCPRTHTCSTVTLLCRLLLALREDLLFRGVGFLALQNPKDSKSWACTKISHGLTSPSTLLDGNGKELT